MAIPQIPDLLRAVLAHSADVEAIPDTTPTGQGVFSYRDGWPVITEVELEAGGIAPDRKFFNEIYRLLSGHTFFSQSGNVYPWVGASEASPGLNYLRGAHVLGSDYQEYVAKKPSGPEIPADGGGFVGPVNPVGDASGAWMPVFSLSTVEKNGINRPDGVTINVDETGKLSVSTATTITAGIVRPDGTTITVDGGLISVSAPFVSHRDVIQTSGTWTSNIRRVIRLTVVGAGGSGGNGGKQGLGGLGGLAGGSTTVTIPAGATLDGELLVSPRTVTAAGGSAGGGGGADSEGGGGEAGDVSEHIVVLPAGATLDCTVGGGGVPYASGWSSSAVGTNGTGPNGGAGGVNFGGGRGAPGAGQGMCYINGYDSSTFGTISPCGYGGQKHPTYGGGAPGGVGQHTYPVPRTGAKPGPGATDAAILTAVDNTYSRAGSGGDGAVIIEYY